MVSPRVYIYTMHFLIFLVSILFIQEDSMRYNIIICSYQQLKCSADGWIYGKICNLQRQAIFNIQIRYTQTHYFISVIIITIIISSISLSNIFLIEMHFALLFVYINNNRFLRSFSIKNCFFFFFAFILLLHHFPFKQHMQYKNERNEMARMVNM